MARVAVVGLPQAPRVGLPVQQVLQHYVAAMAEMTMMPPGTHNEVCLAHGLADAHVVGRSDDVDAGARISRV